MKTTITEALAELKTIDKRVEAKRGFIAQYLMRQEALKDPLEKDGGSFKAIQEAMQSMHDLGERKIAIRRAIAQANQTEMILVQGKNRTIGDWLVWRRDVAPLTKQFLNTMSTAIERQRQDLLRKGMGLTSEATGAKPTDVIVHINEKDLSEDIENVEQVLGTLDGLLSLKNATVTIEVA